MTADYKDTQIEELKKIVRELTEELERLAKAPASIGCIVRVDADYTQLVSPSGLLSFETDKKNRFKPGMIVRLAGTTMAPVDPTKLGDFGPVRTVSKIDKDGNVYLSDAGTDKLVLCAIDRELIKDGTSVVLDPTGNVIVRALEHAKQEFEFHHDLGVDWDHIVGNADAKKELIEAIDFQTTDSAVLKAYGYKPPKGLLFSGPPGCGKTMLGKAAATHIAKKHGQAGGGGFLHVKGPQVLDPYVGVTEATIRELFAKAREWQRKHGTQAIIFIDEADAILGTRGGEWAHMEKTVVPSFLAEMDGLDASGALVILATNRPDTLDPAVTREGRIDRKIRVARPTKEEAAQLLGMKLAKVPVVAGCDVKKLAARGAQELFCASRQLAEVHHKDGSKMMFTLSNVVSGAMVDQAAETASKIALRRDMAAGKIGGVCEDDVVDAVDVMFKGNLDTDHREAMIDASNGKEIVHVRKIKYVESEAA